MGLLTDSLKLVLPERKVAIGATVPTWQNGNPQALPMNYERLAKEGYAANEIVYACVEMLSTSAAEPRMAGYRKTERQPERVVRSATLDLLEHPNPFMSRFQFWATIMLHRSIAGNAYIEKVRSASGKVVELWLLRPDRVKIIPDARTFIRGYEYQIGASKDFLPVENVIHLKARNPYDDYYGLPPLAVAAHRIDTDNFMRSFTTAFFQNAGVPSGLLNIMRTTTDTEREMIRNRFKADYGGMAGWHRLLVIDGEAASYTPMGLPLGERGLVMPELDGINETRITQCFGVRPSLVGAKIAGHGSALAAGSRKADSEAFWTETLVPIYRDFAAAITTSLVPDFPGDLDYVEFDYSDVRALREDEDTKHTRAREDLKAGIFTREETRVMLGHDPEPKPTETWMLPANLLPQPVTMEPDGAGGGIGLNEGSSRSLSTLLANITRLQSIGETAAAQQLVALLGERFGLSVAQAQAQLAAPGANPAPTPSNGRQPALNGAGGNGRGH